MRKKGLIFYENCLDELNEQYKRSSLGQYEILPDEDNPGKYTIESFDAMNNLVKYDDMPSQDKKRAKSVYKSVIKNGLLPKVADNNVDTFDVITNDNTKTAKVNFDDGSGSTTIKYERKRVNKKLNSLNERLKYLDSEWYEGKLTKGKSWDARQYYIKKFIKAYSTKSI